MSAAPPVSSRPAWVAAGLVAAVAVLVVVGVLLALRFQAATIERRVQEVASAAAVGLRLEVTRDLAAVAGAGSRLGDALPALDQATYEQLYDVLRRDEVLVRASAVNLAQAVAAGEVDQLLAALPAEIRSELEVRLGSQDVHLLLTHVWPPWANRSALGFDVLASPDAVLAAERAFREGRVSTSGPVQLIQDPDGQLAAIVYVPIRSSSGEVVGLSTVIFRGQELLDTVAEPDNAVMLRLLDDASDRQLASTAGHDELRSVVVSEQIALPDRRWRLEAAADRGVLTVPERATPWLVLLLGLVVVIGDGYTVRRARRDRARAWALVEDRTAELASTASQLADANRGLRQADEVKDQLLASVSHDLRAPLTVIRGFVELLGTGQLEPEREADLRQRILAQTDRLQRLVDDLLTAAQLQEHGVTVRPEQRRLIELVTEVVDELGIGRLTSGSDTDTQVEVDPVHLQRIVTNLLTNASRHGRPPFEVTLRPPRGDLVEVVVRDHGSGIAPEQQAAVFAAFSRTDGGAAGGLGLGLSIARQLAVANGGSLRYEQPDGPGASFVLALPRVLPDGPTGGQAPKDGRS